MTSPVGPSPLRMSLTMESRSSGVKVLLALGGLLAFVATATFVTARANAAQTDLATRARTENLIASISDRLEAYDEVLYGVRHFFEGVPPERSDFRELADRLDVDSRHPGVQVVGAAHLVDRDDLDRYAAETSAAAKDAMLDYPAFEVYPETTADELLPIDFIEPQTGNERAFGLDFFSETNRRAAAIRARDTNATAATAPVTLVQETGEQRAFLVMLPIYEKGAPLDTVVQRREAFDGVVYAAFRMDDLITGVLGEQSSDVRIVDVDSGEMMFGTEQPSGARVGPRQLNSTQDDPNIGSIEVSGRGWAVVVDDSGPVLSTMERSVPFLTLIGGLAIAALFIALARSMRSARSRAIAMAVEMTDELQALTESTTEAIVSVDGAGNVVSSNRGAQRIFEKRPDDLLGTPASLLVFDEHRPDFDAALAALNVPADASADASDSDPADGADRPFGNTLQLLGERADGGVFPIEMTLSTWTAHGERFRTAFIRDITDRVEADRALLRTGDLLKSVLAAATEMSIIATDVDGLIEVFSRGAERMLGYDSREMVGIQTPAIFHDSDEVVERADELGIAPGFDVFTSSARNGLPETRRWTYVRKDGRLVPAELTVTPRYDANGDLCGFIGVAIDVTMRIAAEDDQQRLLDQQLEIVAKLTEVDRVKNDFVSTTSHELRTPLTSIIGYAELLNDELSASDDVGSVRMIEMIDRNAQRLLDLVEDLLALSEIESGLFEMKNEACDSTAILRSACDAIAPLAARRRIEVHVGFDSLPVIEGDAQQLERVFLNLLSNAVKFSHDGGTIDIDARVDDALVVTVSDNGIGIPADEQEQLFTRFFRSTTADRNAIQGTGLGLAIVANIVQRHGGEIAIESTEDVGTTVRLTLPLRGSHQEHRDRREVLV
jgi:PAS domain S-box-containing protein